MPYATAARSIVYQSVIVRWSDADHDLAMLSEATTRWDVAATEHPLKSVKFELQLHGDWALGS